MLPNANCRTRQGSHRNINQTETMTVETKTLLTAAEVLRRINRPASHLKRLQNNVKPDAVTGRTFLYDPARVLAIEAELLQAEGKTVKL
jgi:hypothetical protein